jgi:integrase
MTPWRTNKRGTFVLDRQFRGVGRIKRATGTDDPKLFTLLDSMLTTLYKAGRVDILQGIHAGVLTPLEVWARFRLGELDRLPTVETMKPLKKTLEAWVEHADAGRWNKASRKYAVRAILRLAKKSATVQDLPALLRAYSSKAGGPVMFNRARSAMQAFLRDTLSRSHPLYGQVRDVRPKRVTARRGKPQSIEELTELTAKLHPAFAAIAWSMALTGMGPGELWGSWTQQKDRIRIRGTKRAGRVRDIPTIRPIAKPTRLYRPFLDALHEASGGTVRPYDLRNTFANWMEAAGIPRARRIVYMGHGTKDITDLYERHEVERFLQDDGEKLRALLGKAPVAAGIRLA